MVWGWGSDGMLSELGGFAFEFRSLLCGPDCLAQLHELQPLTSLTSVEKG